jgi:hypothetical protein
VTSKQRDITTEESGRRRRRKKNQTATAHGPREKKTGEEGDGQEGRRRGRRHRWGVSGRN